MLRICVQPTITNNLELLDGVITDLVRTRTEARVTDKRLTNAFTIVDTPTDVQDRMFTEMGLRCTRTLSDVVRAICATTSTTPATTHEAVGHSAKNPNIVADTTCTQCGVRDQSEGPDRNGHQPRV